MSIPEAPQNWPNVRVATAEASARLSAAIDEGRRIARERVLTEEQVSGILERAAAWRHANSSLLLAVFDRETMRAYEAREWEDFVGAGYSEAQKLRRVREFIESDLLYFVVLHSYLGTLDDRSSRGDDLAASDKGRPDASEISVSGTARPDVFISHCNRDLPLAQALVALVRAALNVRLSQIRCTSVSGSKLPHGTETESTLRLEILQSTTFIGLVTPTSIESTYVLFELGARWVANKHLAPLLGAGGGADLLRGPLGKYNALSCDSAADVHQFVHDLAGHLGVAPEPAAAYQSELEVLLRRSVEAASARNADTSGSSTHIVPRTTVPVAAKPEAKLTDHEVIALIQSWLGGRDARLNTTPIYFDDVDRELALPKGSTEHFIELAAARWRYVVERRGPSLILFRQEPPPRKPSIVDQIPRF